jgi:hypothetical protein
MSTSSLPLPPRQPWACYLRARAAFAMTIAQEIVISLAIATLAVGAIKIATALMWLMVP